MTAQQAFMDYIHLNTQIGANAVDYPRQRCVGVVNGNVTNEIWLFNPHTHKPVRKVELDGMTFSDKYDEICHTFIHKVNEAFLVMPAQKTAVGESFSNIAPDDLVGLLFSFLW